MLKAHEVRYFLDKSRADPNVFNTCFTREFESSVYVLCVDNPREDKAFVGFMVNPKVMSEVESERVIMDDPLKHGHLVKEDGCIEDYAR